MKIIIMLSLNLLAFVGTGYSQDGCPSCCTNRKITSPLVTKPNEGEVISATCSDLMLQWKGNPNQTYIVIGSYFDLITQIRKETQPVIVNACGTCTATIPVLAGTAVSWSIQAVQIIDNKTFHSYALHSKEEHAIPACITPIVEIATTSRNSNSLPKENNVLTNMNDGKMNGVIYPNPVHSTLTIKLKAKSENNVSKLVFIRVFDINGRTLTVKQAILGTIQVNVASLRNGTYFIRIDDASGKLLYTTKFVKQ